MTRNLSDTAVQKIAIRLLHRFGCLPIGGADVLHPGIDAAAAKGLKHSERPVTPQARQDEASVGPMKRRIGLRPSQELRTLLKSCDLSQFVRSRRMIQCFAILHSNLCVHVLSASCPASGLGL